MSSKSVVFNCVDELSPKTVSMSFLVDELSCSRLNSQGMVIHGMPVFFFFLFVFFFFFGGGGGGEGGDKVTYVYNGCTLRRTFRWMDG